MRVMFFGNHTVGVTVLRELSLHAQVVGVVAHPTDPEDGVRYESVAGWADENAIPVVRGRPKDEAVRAFLDRFEFDLIWIADYRYLIPTDVLELALQGAVNLHPSLLPKYRGRAPINWAIIHGEDVLGLTAHWVTPGVDDGPIIMQREFRLGPGEDVGDALRKLYPIYAAVTRDVVAAFHQGDVPRIPQSESDATEFPARRPNDGLIDWKKDAHEIWRLVRAVSHPYPGAFSFLKARKVFIWKARPDDTGGLRGEVGEVVATKGPSFLVQCGSGRIWVESSTDHSGEPVCVSVGDVFSGPVDEERRFERLYDDAAHRRQASHESVLWGSCEGQLERFRVLAEIGNLHEKRILDVGCGLAHFADWLEREGISCDYTGLEINGKMLSVAKRRRADLRLIEGNIRNRGILMGENFDYVFASGIFVYYTESRSYTMWEIISRMWKLCRIGVAVNCLSTWAPSTDPDEFHEDPLVALKRSSELTRWVVLRHDYHPRDFTLYLTRTARAR